jgi:uncharacterized protein with PIN domain
VRIVVDTSVVIAVIADEPEKAKLIELTKDSVIVAPQSVKWEVGNAFSAMLKRSRINLSQALEAIDVYDTISIEMVEINLRKAVKTGRKASYLCL